MSDEKKLSAKDLFKDYVPEIVEYDSMRDAKPPKKEKNHSTYVKEETKVYEKYIITVPAAEMFDDYKPEILQYNPKIDGSDEHKIRDRHLDTKAALIEKVRLAKAAKKSNQTTFRQNIRTENEQ
jgi:hypothetical protein